MIQPLFNNILNMPVSRNFETIFDLETDTVGIQLQCGELTLMVVLSCAALSLANQSYTFW